MVLPTAIRLASISSGPRMIFSRCSTARFTPRCTGWSEGDGSRRSGKRLLIGIGNSSITGLRTREENSLSSKNLNGSGWRRRWHGSCGLQPRRAEMKWWQVGKRNADLQRELQADLQLEEEEQRENGIAPEEARYAALRAFGNPSAIREQTRGVWSWDRLETLLRDLRISIRTLARQP